MLRKRLRSVVLGSPLFSFFLLLGLLLYPSVQAYQANAGHFVYVLDDPYIHLAIAKNVHVTGVWGISAGVFSSASSSPLWTMLLILLGGGVFWPFVLNVLCALGVLVWAKQRLVVSGRWVERSGVWSEAYTALFVVGFAFPAVIFCGLEHLLHALLMLLAVEGVARDLSQPREERRPWTFVEKKSLGWWWLPLGFMGLVRYESLFLVGVAGLIYLAQRRLGRALSLGVIACGPVLAFGVWSWWQGGFGLPNPILVKGATSAVFSARGFSVLSERFLDNIGQAPEVLSLIVMGGVLFWLLHRGDRALLERGEQDDALREWRALRWSLVLCLGVAGLHLLLARTGWFYRYELYLLCLLGVFVARGWVFWVGYAAQDASHKQISVFGLLGMCVFLFGARAVDAQSMISPNLQGIYRQPYQVASFLRTYKRDVRVILQDIGLVAHKTNAQITDLMGLGDQEVALMLRRGNRKEEALKRLVQKRRSELAVLYNRGPIEGWCAVATWRQNPKLCCASDTVVFSVPRRGDITSLRLALQHFSARLPSGVEVRWVSPKELTTCRKSTEKGKESTEKGKESTEKGKESTEKGKESTEKGKESTEKGKESTERGRKSTEKGKESTGKGRKSTERGRKSTKNKSR